MSEDDETMVRRRLYRLTDGVSALRTAGPPGQPPGPGRSPGPPPDPGWSPGRPLGPGGLGDDVGGLAIRPPVLTADADPVPAGGLSGGLPGPGVFDPGRRGVRALAAVAVVVVLGAGFWAWRSRPQAEPVRPTPTVTGPEASGGSVPGPAGHPTGEVVVAVAGKVRRPGLVRVPAGARVADVVEAAGGALPGVDVALLNPARKVADGELILVGVTAPPGAAGEGSAPAAAPGGGVPGGKVNLNSATLAQLDTLPGVGPVLAQRILTHRDRQGGFRSVGDLRQVDGIGDARYEQLKDLVTV
ncbi:ComEA family DNA-binding protein [Micromonospora sp. WMMD714]|uniref:ComEA family DNA-binding protein n=1 Tax=Micromonospora sp. WMMD714 TaxID=3016097 RepID=UPI00249C6E92|nr:ComEA family DNA-binding protein [Micromonospora sp. WMMD714]WFE61874.1 ComEA family DNA-binding protein [Micromonospora sp. WMMD714]